MKIKKTFQGELPENRVVNAKSNSATDAYSANYLNDKLNKVVVSPTEPITGEDVWIKRSSNILKFDDFTETVNGITFTMKDQVLHVEGTATAYTQSCYITVDLTLEEAMTLTVDWDDDNLIPKAAYTYDGTSYYPNLYSQELEPGTYLNKLYFIIANGATVNTDVRFQLERGRGFSGWQPVMEKAILVKNDNDVYEDLIKKSVHVGVDKPKNGEEVWIQKGKNIFNIGDISPQWAIWGNDEGASTELSNTSGYMPVTAQQKYTFSCEYSSLASAGDRSYIFYNSKKEYLYTLAYNSSDKEISITPTQDGYVRISYDKNCYNIQFELGNKTNYEPFIRKIHTKNDNGGYEDFYDKTNREVYSLAEQRIGTWIDGKPLYRKVYKLNNLPSTNTDLVNITNLNIRELTKLYGLINTYNNFTFPMPLQDSDANYSVLFKSGNSIRGRGSVGTGYDGYIVTIVVEYTKTTD
jgi:hypothetical protein